MRMKSIADSFFLCDDPREGESQSFASSWQGVVEVDWVIPVFRHSNDNSSRPFRRE